MRHPVALARRIALASATVAVAVACGDVAERPSAELRSPEAADGPAARDPAVDPAVDPVVDPAVDPRPSDPAAGAGAPSSAAVQGQDALASSDVDAQWKADYQAVVEAWTAAAPEHAGPLEPGVCQRFRTAFLDLAARTSGVRARLTEFNAAVVLERCGEREAAVQRYASLCDRGSALACNNLGVIRWNEGATEEAMDLFARTVELEATAHGGP